MFRYSRLRMTVHACMLLGCCTAYFLSRNSYRERERTPDAQGFFLLHVSFLPRHVFRSMEWQNRPVCGYWESSFDGCCGRVSREVYNQNTRLIFICVRSEIMGSVTWSHVNDNILPRLALSVPASWIDRFDVGDKPVGVYDGDLSMERCLSKGSSQYLERVWTCANAVVTVNDVETEDVYFCLGLIPFVLFCLGSTMLGITSNRSGSILNLVEINAQSAPFTMLILSC